jgi:hypothetical protein
MHATSIFEWQTHSVKNHTRSNVRYAFYAWWVYFSQWGASLYSILGEGITFVFICATSISYLVTNHAPPPMFHIW